MRDFRLRTKSIIFGCAILFCSTYPIQSRADSQTSTIPETCNDFISSHDGTDQHKKNIADAYLGALTVKGMFLAKAAREKDQNLMPVDENTPTIIKSEAINVCRGQPNAILSEVILNLIDRYQKGPYYR